MSHDRKAGELCALTGLSCCDGRCVQFNRCMAADYAAGPSAVSESAARKAAPVTQSPVPANFDTRPGAVNRVDVHLVTAKDNGACFALPTDSAARKAAPVWAGVLNYFPDALMAVARVSKAGNDKHNPGQSLHWSRDKSSDHLDCAARHMLTPFAIDPDSKEIHLANAAWRILAELQLYQEKQRASH